MKIKIAFSVILCFFFCAPVDWIAWVLWSVHRCGQRSQHRVRVSSSATQCYSFGKGMHHDSKRRFDFSCHLLVVITMIALQKLDQYSQYASNTFTKCRPVLHCLFWKILLGLMEWVFLMLDVFPAAQPSASKHQMEHRALTLTDWLGLILSPCTARLVTEEAVPSVPALRDQMSW